VSGYILNTFAGECEGHVIIPQSFEIISPQFVPGIGVKGENMPLATGKNSALMLKNTNVLVSCG
jgi:hypothetical protein